MNAMPPIAVSSTMIAGGSGIVPKVCRTELRWSASGSRCPVYCWGPYEFIVIVSLIVNEFAVVIAELAVGEASKFEVSVPPPASVENV
jgi:hypothetical protein